MTLNAGDNSDTTQTANAYTFILFISGMSLKSIQAIENLRELCETYLPGRFHFEVIDVYQQGHMASRYQIIATPTLIKFNPAPQKTILGDLSDTKKVLRILDIDDLN